MQCPLLTGREEWLLDYAAGRLSGQLRQPLQFHLQECPRCRQLVSEQEQLWNALECWQPKPISPDFKARVLARLHESATASSWQRYWQNWKALLLKPAMATAVAAGLLLGILYLNVRKAPPPQPPQEVAVKSLSREIIDVEQLDQLLRDMEMLKELNELAKESGETL